MGGQWVESSHGDNADWSREDARRWYALPHILLSIEPDLRQTTLSPFNTVAARNQDRLTHGQLMPTEDCVRQSAYLASHAKPD
jgi:hypothetical protein